MNSVDNRQKRGTTMRHINSEKIMAFYDNELSIEESTAVKEHLNHCPECSVTLNSFQKTTNLINKLPVSKANIIPPFSAIKAGAAAHTRVKKSNKWLIRLHNKIKPLIATTAAVIILVTVFFLSDIKKTSNDEFSTETCMVEQETDAIVQGYDSLPKYYN